jgi:hypothetical protein
VQTATVDSDAAVGAPDWLDELSLQPGPPWLSMGLHALDPAAWLVVDGDREPELARKAQLLAERHDEVFLARSGTEAAGQEVLDLVGAWLAAHSPAGLASGAPTETGATLPVHPLERAGLLVQEDLCLMVERGGHYVLEAGSVCFPSHWRLAEKMGRPMAGIHGPVPHYAAELEGKVDRFFDKLRPSRPVMRRNLGIHSHDELFSPGPREPCHAFPADARGVDSVWVRSERQTLRRLATSGAILFTIRTQQCRMRALEHRADVAHALAAKLRAQLAESARLGEAPSLPAWLPDWLAAR